MPSQTREFAGAPYYSYGDEGESLIWSPVNDYSLPLRCSCGSTTFRILYTGDYETSGECTQCGTRGVVHCG